MSVTAISDPRPVLHDAIVPENSAFLDDDLVEHQTAIPDDNRLTNRGLPTLCIADTGLLRTPQNAVLPHRHRGTESDRCVQPSQPQWITAHCSASQSTVIPIASSSRSRESNP